MYVSPFIEMESHYEISLKTDNKNHFICNIQQFDINNKNIFFASLDIQLKSILNYNLLNFFEKHFFHI